MFMGCDEEASLLLTLYGQSAHQNPIAQM
jgi:hypothetical protein